MKNLLENKVECTGASLGVGNSGSLGRIVMVLTIAALLVFYVAIPAIQAGISNSGLTGATLQLANVLLLLLVVILIAVAAGVAINALG